MSPDVDLAAILRDGAILSILASAFIVAVMRLEPRIFLRHYPAEIKAAAEPLSARGRVIGRLISLPFLALLAAVPWLSAGAYVAAHPSAEFSAVAVHAFGVAMVFNLVDWLVLDELWLGALRPRWAMPRGAEEVTFRFNHLHHARGFLVGTILSAVLALTIATALRGLGQ